MALYKGYSSFEYERVKTLRLNDIELVKMDILNHLFTRYGERVMMPNFGSIIPDILFEPLDDETVETVQEEIAAVVNFDPRVKLLELVPIPDFDRGILQVHTRLRFIEFDIVDNMDLNITFEGS